MNNETEDLLYKIAKGFLIVGIWLVPIAPIFNSPFMFFVACVCLLIFFTIIFILM